MGSHPERGGGVFMSYKCFRCKEPKRFPCYAHFHLYCPDPVLAIGAGHHVYRYCKPCRDSVPDDSGARDIWCQCQKGRRGSRLAPVGNEERSEPPQRERFMIKIARVASPPVAKGYALLDGEHGRSVAGGDAKVGEQLRGGDAGEAGERGPGGELRVADKVGAPKAEVPQRL